MSHASTLVNKCEPRMFFRYLLIQSHHCKKVTLHFFLVGVWKIQNRPPPLSNPSKHTQQTHEVISFVSLPPHHTRIHPSLFSPDPNAFGYCALAAGGLNARGSLLCLPSHRFVLSVCAGLPLTSPPSTKRTDMDDLLEPKSFLGN